MFTIKPITLTTTLLVALFMASCGGDSTGPDKNNDKTTGTLKVSTTTSGQDKDTDGYTITLDGGAGKSAGASATVTFTDVAKGTHTLELSGLASNCALENKNTQDVAVFAGDTAKAGFAISCKTQLRDKIVFTGVPDNGDPNLYLINADGSGQTQLTNDAATEFGAAISPDGTHIAYGKLLSSKEEYHLMDADGSNDQLLAQFSQYISTQILVLSWSPDGQKLAFNGVNSAGDYHVYQVNADGNNQKLLISSDSTDVISTNAWSPDGQKLVFASRQGGGPALNIYTIKADGTGLKQLTDNDNFSFLPSWSPAGNTIAFVSDRNNNEQQLFTMTTEGKSVTQISEKGAVIYPFSWSPDGTKLIYSSDTTGELYKSKADGTGPEINVTNSPNFTDVAPFWSPVGK